MKFVFAVICVLWSFPFGAIPMHAFDPDLSSFSKDTIQKAKANSPVEFMTDKEEEVVFFLNLVRLEPQLFLTEIVKPYVEAQELVPNKYVKSLYTDLKKVKPTQPLFMKQDLYKVAYDHLKDIGPKGIEGHTGSRGKTYTKRVKHLLNTYYGVSENIGLGFDDPLGFVIGLLIDDGVKSLGHRKAILNADYNCVGVTLGTHKEFGTGCVMDFGILESKTE